MASESPLSLSASEEEMQLSLGAILSSALFWGLKAVLGGE